MAKNISLLGADYPDVPAVQLPQTGGGTATFYDIRTETVTVTTDETGRVYIGTPTKYILAVSVNNTSYWCYTRYAANGEATLLYIRQLDSFTPAAETSVQISYSYIQK